MSTAILQGATMAMVLFVGGWAVVSMLFGETFIGKVLGVCAILSSLLVAVWVIGFLVEAALL